MPDVQIRVASWDEEQKVGALMALGFADDPFVRWILPDPYEYIQNSLCYAGLSWGSAFDAGSAFIVGQSEGAAIWMAPGATVKRDPKIATPKQETPPGFPQKFAELKDKSAAFRPTEPHWYLACIVVDPASRGKGYGTALLDHGLNICDLDNLPAYLESTNAANLSLYKRFGFETLAKVTVGNSPARYPMLRPAKK